MKEKGSCDENYPWSEQNYKNLTEADSVTLFGVLSKNSGGDDHNRQKHRKIDLECQQNQNVMLLSCCKITTPRNRKSTRFLWPC